jgi:transposase
VSSKFRPECQPKYIHELLLRARLVRRYLFVLRTICRHYRQKSFDKTHDVYIIILTSMTRKTHEDPKTSALRKHGALNPRPDKVRDEAFLTRDFFDPRDRVQIRYEMVRRHRVDERPASEVAETFGVSRQTFYLTEAIFSREGLAGLLPRRRGPKAAHKCTDEILDFVEKWRISGGAANESVADAIRKNFGVAINPRSIDRAMQRRKKNTSRRNQQQASDPDSI